MEPSLTSQPLNWVSPLKRTRKKRSVNEKRQIVMESLSSSASIAAIARTHNINPNLLHNWRWQYRRGELGPVNSKLNLVAVKIADQPCTQGTTELTEPQSSVGHIEIIIGDTRILVHGSVQGEMIESVLKALQR